MGPRHGVILAWVQYTNLFMTGAGRPAGEQQDSRGARGRKCARPLAHRRSGWLALARRAPARQAWRLWQS